MKKTCYILLTAALAAFMMAGCAKNEPFAAAGEDDTPRILNTNIPEWENGVPGILTSVPAGEKFNFTIIVTPVAYTTITWNMDGTDIFEGAEIDMELPAGTHLFKVTATSSKGKSTSRSFQVVVRSGETVVWEGSHPMDDPSWTPFALDQEIVSKFQSGVTVRAYVYRIEGADYALACLTTTNWRQILTGHGDPDREDITVEGEMVLEYPLTDDSMKFMQEDGGGAQFVGYGYTITKITVE